MRRRLAFAIAFALAAGFGCDTGSPIAFVLPSLDGTWNIQLLDVPGTLRVVVEGGRITQYDQGGGTFQPIEEMPAFTQIGGTIMFTMQATQAFVGFNNGEPTEFIVAGSGEVQSDGSVDLTITFTAADGSGEGSSKAIMSR
ncbi:MAG: hypothetical protein H6819_12915 [Phycisphaerales bacterium]|nr:hypothetical protein [Phycisphaerales bacterium]MCB9857798.1 hypothetical protein [Phycisphaerales bacterium]MCB9863858.1 hypothetical protein [Phycisphaerales bacterium]